MSSFHEILTEIVEKITIDGDFTISHPNYPPRSTNPETLGKLQQLAADLQQKYLIAQLQSYLYEIYFSHSLVRIQELETSAQQPPIVKNNTIDGIDIDFYPRLQQSNTSRGYIDPDWEIVTTTDRGELIVVKNGLHLHIDPQQHLAPEFDRAAAGQLVPIYLPHNLIGQDTYIAIADAGLPASTERIQIYFNFTPDAAIEIERQLTSAFNRLGIPFQLAILHDPAIFYRYDGGTLELNQSDYRSIQPVLTEVYQQHQAAFSAHIPICSKQLAPGLGLVEVPDSNSFGQHRCQLLATGLVRAIDLGQIAVTEKLNTIHHTFQIAGIDLAQPHLNPAAIDRYPFLFG
jgi:HopA1 effector protein family